MRHLLHLPLGFLVLPLTAAPVFIGTGGGDAKGIYRADFDAASGKLTAPTLAAEYNSPGFLALHPEKPILYSIGNPKKPFPNGSGSVAAFSIADDHSLKFLADASCGGRGPCHLVVDATGKTLAVANYGDGSIVTITLDKDGLPGKAASIILNKGEGPNTQRQDGPHAHGLYFDKANKHLFVPDLGLDTTLVYQFDAGTSVIRPHNPVGLKSAPGAGPRHMDFSPDEKHAYVINELDNTILAASYNAEKGTLTEIQTVPTLPADFKGQNTTAEIEVHSNGKFVYGSNRGHDSIVVYARDPETGKLTFVQHAPCGGKTPRHFAIDPSGKWLLCGHQGSNTISVLPLDPATGKLGAPTSTVDCPAPICILFPR